MAAATNKPGAVHYALVLFVILSVVLGITTYMFQRGESDRMVENAKLTADNQNLNKLQRDLDESVEALKKRIGINLSKVDDATNPQNQATVVGGLNGEISANGRDVAGTNVIETLRKMREAIDAIAADRDAKAAKIQSLEKELLALKDQYQAQVDKYSNDAKGANREKITVIADRDEKINAKTQEIAKLRSELNSTKDELSQEKESRDKERKDLQNKIVGLEIRIDALREKIDDLEKLSFEVADGKIRRVEHTNHTVWINLGEQDFLKPRTTFSVYGQENQGVGRGAEDIKGKIEVTRILGPHMAEARIIDEDLYRPIVSEDLIYTPIWSPGLIERISIVGTIDLDNDGRSDREQFHEMMKVAGCIIDNEVDDDGNRIPEDGKITVQTRFLVRGDIPDLADASPDDKEKIQKIMTVVSEMQNEARINGVRVIKLNDFLAYIGYHSKRRTFLASQVDRPFMLRAGTASVLQNGGSLDRTSNGSTSALFDKKKRQARQETSDGATSKSFGGDGK